MPKFALPNVATCGSTAGGWQTHIIPDHDSADDGFSGIAPVAQCPPNAYGLYDITGNVWQWNADWYNAEYYQQLGSVHIIKSPKGPSAAYDPNEPGVAKRMQRGGSFLCTEQYLTHYLVGSRGKGEASSATNHVGFRCVRNLYAYQTP